MTHVGKHSMTHIPVATSEQDRALLGAVWEGIAFSPELAVVARVVCEQCGPPRWLASVLDAEPYQLLMATKVAPDAEPVGILLGHPFRHSDVSCTVVCPRHGSVELDPERVRRQLRAGPPSGHANGVVMIRVRCARQESDSAEVPSTTR